LPTMQHLSGSSRCHARGAARQTAGLNYFTESTKPNANDWPTSCISGSLSASKVRWDYLHDVARVSSLPRLRFPLISSIHCQ
jgi:hypothetical protein